MTPETKATQQAFQTKKFYQVNKTIKKYGGDPRLILTAPCALLLQVAHPTVSAGVKEHSDYLNNPWLRLLRTLDFVFIMTFGKPKDMIDMGEVIKQIHTEIRGTKSNGQKYSALEPEAYAWVHATLAYLFVKGNEYFGEQMSKQEIEELWNEWKEIGYLIHVQKKALPETWNDFLIYFDKMIDERLEKTPEVCDLIQVLNNPPAPIKLLQGKLWNATMIPVSNLSMLLTGGLLPPKARKLLGITWSPFHQFAFDSYTKISKKTTPYIPNFILNSGPLYIQLRKFGINGYYKINI